MIRTISSSFYRLLWILAHNLVTISVAIFHVGLEFREKIVNFIKNIAQERRKFMVENERIYVESQSSYVKKLPKHLAVILSINNKKDVDLGRLSKLVEWSLVSGVNFISFYDYKGIIRNDLNRTFEKIVQRITVNDENEKIVWGPNYQTSNGGYSQIPHKNGFRKHLIVNLFSSDDGHRKFTKLLTEELVNVKSENITCNLVDEKLSKTYGNLPDPDCAVYFGTFQCTQGFLPWHIRLTEFYQLSYKLETLSPQKYLQVIYSYGKCDQRFGK